MLWGRNILFRTVSQERGEWEGLFCAGRTNEQLCMQVGDACAGVSCVTEPHEEASRGQLVRLAEPLYMGE